MKKKIIFISLLIMLPQINYSQKFDKEIRDYLENGILIKEVETIIDQTIESNNPNRKTNEVVLWSTSENSDNISETDLKWVSFKNKIKEKGIKSFIDHLIPIYKETFTDKELKTLIKFSQSKIGRSIENKQKILQEKVRTMAVMWSMELNDLILKELNNRNRTTMNDDEIEKFKKQFSENNQVIILNLEDLKIDNKNNPGTLLVDFENGKKSEIALELKNIGKENLELKNFGVLGDELSIEFENNPIKPNETGKIIFRLDKTKTNTSSKYQLINIFSNTKFKLAVGIKYENIENKHYNPISYSVTPKKIKFTEFNTELSKPYTFTFKNTSDIDISLSIEIDNNYTFLNYPKGKIKPNETVSISIIFSKSLIEKYKPEKISADLKVYIGKYIDMSMFSFNEKDNNKLKLIID